MVHGTKTYYLQVAISERLAALARSLVAHLLVNDTVRFALGIAPYPAKSGINTVGGSAGATYLLTDHWSLGAHVSYGKLQGDAANSPVTTDKTQRVYGAFVMYRF
jgi:hypothetical protein